MVKNARMTKRVLLILGLSTGAYVGWRARGGLSREAESAMSRGRARASDATASLRAEKARAIVELGRERALQALDQVLGGRLRDAA